MIRMALDGVRFLNYCYSLSLLKSEKVARAELANADCIYYTWM